MLNPALYLAMFERKSIRHYSETPLDSEQLAQVRQAIADATPLLPDARYQLELVEAKDGWRIAGYSQDASLAHLNLGFVLQQVDLQLHQAGLGRLWFGMGHAPKDVEPKPGLHYVLALKVGVADEVLARPLVSDFERAEPATLLANPENYAWLEAVRLAPSACNSQPWVFRAAGPLVHVYRRKPKGLLLLNPKLNELDIGIALCHLALALEHEGQSYAVEPAAVNPPDADGAIYMLTLRIEDGCGLGL